MNISAQGTRIPGAHPQPCSVSAKLCRESEVLPHLGLDCTSSRDNPLRQNGHLSDAMSGHTATNASLIHCCMI